MRKIAVLSDTHANFPATCAAIHHAKQHDADAFWFLGDLVGRGPQPVRTLNCLRNVYEDQSPEDRRAWLMGNHDAVVLNQTFAMQIGEQALGPNNNPALKTDLYNRAVLERRGKGLLEFLDSLPPYASPQEGIYLAHAAYQVDGQGEVDETHALYFAPTDITAMFENLLEHSLAPRMVLSGHTHIPTLWQWDPQRGQAVRLPIEQPRTFEALDQRPLYINVGSVGFPRQGAWPTYVMLELDENAPQRVTVTFHRFEFQVEKVLLALPYDYPEVFRQELLHLQRLFENHHGG